MKEEQRFNSIYTEAEFRAMEEEIKNSRMDGIGVQNFRRGTKGADSLISQLVARGNVSVYMLRIEGQDRARMHRRLVHHRWAAHERFDGVPVSVPCIYNPMQVRPWRVAATA